MTDSAESTLRAAGWRVCNPSDRSMLPGGEAVRTPGASGEVLYLLYVDHELAGVVAVGPSTDDPEQLLAKAEAQAAPLAERHGQRAFAKRPLPFRYGTNGAIWCFRNVLDGEHLDGSTAPDALPGGARSRGVFAPHQPATVARWMREAQRDPQAPTLRARLRQLPSVPLDHKRLRSAQYKAIKGLEKSLAKDDPRALIQMATGAGKTYTVVQSSYRLLKHASAHRVLFLVDRNNLGKQAFTEYHGFQPLGSRQPLHQQMPLKLLAGGALADSDKIVISTIQRLWCKLAGLPVPGPDNEDFEEKEADRLAGKTATVQYTPELPPDYFDVIVVDECHRSIYGRWKPVLEYFDAHVIGLTATPIAPTFAFFHKNLVSSYTYDDSVADGVNVDYDVYKIATKITQQGSVIPAQTQAVHPDGTVEQINTVLAKINKLTREQHWAELSEDDPYAPQEINHRVRSEDQIRTVIRTFKEKLFSEIFPPVINPETGEARAREIVPKTLIFAQRDLHADAITKAVREIFQAGDGFCRKITSKASQPDQALADFRNKPGLRIAVTVDMIATGTDVPALECLIFMRDIRTWSYFEQMKGRGARTISDQALAKITADAVHKDRFVIVDAVGVTEHEKVDARPLVRDNDQPLPSLERLLRACAEGRPLHANDTATLAGRLSRLRQRLDEETLAGIERCAGGLSFESLVSGLVQASDADRRATVRTEQGAQAEAAELAEAVRPLAEREELRAALLEAATHSWLLIDDISQDQVLEARGLTDEEEAKATVDDWHAYMNAAEHQDDIMSLWLAFEDRRPPREVLRELKALIKKVRATRRQWTEQKLWKAYVDLGIARDSPRRNAGLVEFLTVLRFELGLDGEEFRPYRSTVEGRLQAWLARQRTAGVTFDEQQLEWLHRVMGVVAANATIEVPSLDKGLCAKAGGYGDFVAAFAGSAWEPEELVDELDRELGA
ncbi:type III restriction enzyme [Streptomyces platensis subsp. clarensis]|nr:type III restriction enzyme [Streptomyces platensis subsp. clarensis]